MQNRLSRLIQARAENVMNDQPVELSFLEEGQDFPLVIKPRYAGLRLEEWTKDNTGVLYDYLNKYGAVLFRKFQIDKVQKFQDFIAAFDAQPLEYKQRSSPRYEVAKNIYHSTTYPADQHINMHSENSYARKWPMKIVFCCIEPSSEQGQTPIADNRKVLDLLPHATKEKFLGSGVRYVRNITKGIGLPWQEVFQTDKKEVVEEECRNNGMQFSWEGTDCLTLSWNNKAIHDHPVTGRQVWFNHAFFFNKYLYHEDVLSSIRSDKDLPFNTYYGDGTEITKEEIEEIRMAYEQSTIVFSWEKGDVLFMDNMLASHGRRPYKGSREIIVSMF